MGNDKSKFFIFRSPLTWVALGLAIILIGLSVETAAHNPNFVQPNHIRLTVNLQSGVVTKTESCTNCTRTDHPNIPAHDQGALKVWLEFYPRNPNCVTIYHNGNPIEVCAP